MDEACDLRTNYGQGLQHVVEDDEKEEHPSGKVFLTLPLFYIQPPSEAETVVVRLPRGDYSMWKRDKGMLNDRWRWTLCLLRELLRLFSFEDEAGDDDLEDEVED
ncbi:hypothetical protein L1887_30191 [Cichorium endivia]|nr:hypothetical protein L1887_30191 [Cichorium endivia]